MSDVQSTSVDPAERFLQRMTPVQRVHSILHRYPALSPAVVLILAAVVLSALPLVFVYIVGRRQLVAGLTAGFSK